MAEAVYVPRQRELKYLDFVDVLAIQIMLCVVSLYELAKEKAGPLKGGVQSAESTVKSLVDPVYKRFHDLPLDLLCLADRKVASVVGVVEQHVPATIKTITFHIYTGLQRVTEELSVFLTDTRRVGLCASLKAAGDRYKPITVGLFSKYELTAKQYAIASWQLLNRLPLFPQAAHFVLPTVGYWAEKYNHAVESAGTHHVVLVQHLPEIPIEKIVKLFKGNSMERETGAVTEPEVATDDSKTIAEPEAKMAETASPEAEGEADSTEVTNHSDE